MTLLNAHTHRLEAAQNERIIHNFIIPYEEELLAADTLELPEGWLSVGIHPWYIHEEMLDEQLLWLRRLAAHPEVKFIGETGLDRLQGPPPEVQELVFRKHISLANELGKPLIIHCVRCFNELVSIKKIIRPQVPLIVHGFMSRPAIAQQLLDKDFYLSFGAAILQENAAATEALKLTPPDKLLLETDEHQAPIEQVYEAAAKAKNISVNDLSELVWENYMLLLAGG